MSLQYADRLYRLAERATHTVEDIYWEDLRKIDRATLALYKRHRESEIWNEFNRQASWVVWDLRDTPLPMDHPLLDVAGRGEKLQQVAKSLKHQVEPRDLALALEVAIGLRQLAEVGNDGLGECCRSILAGGDLHRSRLVVTRSRYRQAIEERFRKEGCPVKVIVQGEVRHLGVLERLVTVGQMRRYKEYLFNSPRAEEICTVRYKWLQRTDVSRIDSARLFPPLNRTVGSTGDDSLIGSQKVEDVLSSRIDWSSIRRQAKEGAGIEPHRDVGAEVEARLYLLGGGYGVYLDDLGKVYVLDVENDSGVSQVPVREVFVDTAIVLRRERGGKDFIADVADSLLGDTAGELRSLQERWKTALQEKVWELGGVPRTEEVLRRRGARYQNVRYWMTDSIKTQNREDFRILMELVGMGEDADFIWGQMGLIDRAHRSAGHRIRAMLFDEIPKADLRRLVREGYLDIELPLEGAGVLTAFLVESKAPKREPVPTRVLRATFPVSSGDMWLL